MLSKGLKKAQAKIKKFNARISKMGSGLMHFSRNGALAFAGFMTGIAASMYKAQEFNKSIGQIATLTDLTARQVKKQVRSMSAEFGLAKEELTKGLYDALSAGVPKDNVFEFMRVASKMAIGGASTTAESVDLLTTVLNAFGMKASEVGKVSDLLFMSVKQGKTTIPELANSFAQVAPLANASGIALEEVTAAVTTLTKQGTPTAQAMTQIRAAIIAMNKTLGDGWSASMTLQDGMQAMADMAGGSQTALKNLTGRVEGALAIMSMTGDKARMAADDLDAMNNSIGASVEAFAKMADQNPLDKLGQSLKNIVLTAGDAALQALAPTIERAAKAAANFAERIADWASDEKIKNMRDQIEGISNALIDGGDSRGEALTAMGEVIKSYFLIAVERAVNYLEKKAPVLGKLLGAAAVMAWKAIRGPSSDSQKEAKAQLLAEGKIKQTKQRKSVQGTFGAYEYGEKESKAERAERSRLVDIRALEIEQAKTLKKLGIENLDNVKGQTVAEKQLAVAKEKLAQIAEKNKTDLFVGPPKPDGFDFVGPKPQWEKQKAIAGPKMKPYDKKEVEAVQKQIDNLKEKEKALRSTASSAFSKAKSIGSIGKDKWLKNMQANREALKEEDKANAKANRAVEKAKDKQKRGIKLSKNDEQMIHDADLQKKRVEQQLAKQQKALKEADDLKKDIEAKEKKAITIQNKIQENTKKTADNIDKALTQGGGR